MVQYTLYGTVHTVQGTYMYEYHGQTVREAPMYCVDFTVASTGKY